MKLNNLLNAIRVGISSEVPELASCAICDGPLETSDLDGFKGTTPAVRIAALGATPIRETDAGQIDLPVSFIAYAMTEDTPGKPRNQAAMDLIETLVNRISGNRWNEEDAHPAEVLMARNHHDATAASQAVALWSVSWTQKVRIGTQDFQTEFPKLSQLHVGMNPNIGPGHEGDYTSLEVTP